MNREEFYERLERIRARFEAIAPENAMKQARYNAIRAEMVALAGHEAAANIEREAKGDTYAQPPDFMGVQRQEMRRALWQLVFDYSNAMCDALVPHLGEELRK